MKNLNPEEIKSLNLVLETYKNTLENFMENIKVDQKQMLSIDRQILKDALNVVEDYFTLIEVQDVDIDNDIDCLNYAFNRLTIAKDVYDGIREALKEPTEEEC